MRDSPSAPPPPAAALEVVAVFLPVMEMWEDLMVHSDDEEDQAAAPMAFL